MLTLDKQFKELNEEELYQTNGGGLYSEEYSPLVDGGGGCDPAPPPPSGNGIGGAYTSFSD